MKEKIKNLSLNGKNTIVMCAIGFLGFIVLLPYAFKGNLGLSLGFLLGSFIEIICFRLLCLTSDAITRSVDGSPKTSLVLISTFGFFIRYGLYAAGLVLAAFDTFRWKSNSLNIWTTFAGYLPMAIIIAVTYLKNVKHNGK